MVPRTSSARRYYGGRPSGCTVLCGNQIFTARSLVLVGIYLAACLLGVGWGFYVFVVRPFKFYQFVLFVISLWILQVVLKFWRYLSAVDPARARILASPRRRHASQQQQVRRLESGASD